MPKPGLVEDLGGQEVVGESLDIFRLQQDIAHANGIKCTIQMTYASLYNDEAIQLAKDYHEKYGDEIGHTFPSVSSRPVWRDLRLQGTGHVAIPLGSQGPPRARHV